jgi:hypothetical protein
VEFALGQNGPAFKTVGVGLLEVIERI